MSWGGPGQELLQGTDKNRANAAVGFLQVVHKAMIKLQCMVEVDGCWNHVREDARTSRHGFTSVGT